MDDGSHGRLAQLFPRLDVLATSTRLELSELLSTPASIPAVLTQEIAGLALPVSDDARRALRFVIERGLGAEALAALRPLRFSDVVPAIGNCEDGPAVDGCPERLRAALRSHAASTWHELAAVSLGQVTEWRGIGPLALAGLVGAAVEAVLGSDHTADERESDPPPDPGPDDDAAALAVLLHHEQATGGHALRRALKRCAASGPTEVQAAATRLLVGAARAGDPRLAELARVWDAAGNHRDRGVHRALRLDRPTSTREFAEALGLSDNRVLQIQSRAEQRTREAVSPAVKTLATDLGDRLGPVCRLAAVDGALAALGLPPNADRRSALLVWLAGPYLPVNGCSGWLATDPTTVLADSMRLLHEDGGVRPLDQVAADLQRAGIATQDVDDWLASLPVLPVDGLMVALSGSTADVAERLLSATGRAMTAAELAATAPGSQDATVLDGRLRRDPRFVRVDRDHFELADWGSAVFSEPRPPAPAELFPREGRGRSQLRIEVDAAALRGAGGPVPLTVVEALGVVCGARRTFTTRYGPVALSHTAAQVSRGSIRPVALAAGAGPGDALVLEFDAATGAASVELVPMANSAAS